MSISDPGVPRPAEIRVTCIDYCHEQVQVQEVHDIADFLGHHRPPWSRVRWINIDGVHQPELIHAFAEKYQLHPLAVEDVMHTVQRPKLEDYPASGEHPGRLFVVARSVEVVGERLGTEQVSMFLGRNTLLTIQEAPGDAFDEVRKRLHTEGSRLRENDVSFLLYALMDATVDSYFPILEDYSERLEDVEEKLLTTAGPSVLQQLHTLRRELLVVRRAAWPMRELVAQLQREKHECLSETTQTYFRDVYDHAVQIIDLVETYREIAASMMETYMSVVSNRMNEVVKVLTIIGTIFIPLTFLAGVYGMNMPIPENSWRITYLLFWIVSLAIAGGMLYWFRRRGWI
jgi:magnesium transporter